jgi:deoxyadenosine/deoxycytidine kinase
MKSRQVVVIGNIGVGKTTLLSQLKQLPHTDFILADELYLTNPFFPLSKTDSKRWGFTNDLWFLLKRVELTAAYFAKKHTHNVVIDSGVWMSYVYAQSHHQMGWLSDDEWKLFEELFDHLTASLPKPDRVVFLEAPFETLWERIKQRNRAFEQDGYLEYLRGLAAGLDGLVAKFAALDLPISRIDTTSLTPEKVAEQVTQLLTKK